MNIKHRNLITRSIAITGAALAAVALFGSSAFAVETRQPLHKITTVDFYSPVHAQISSHSGEYKAADGALLNFSHYRPRHNPTGEAVIYLHGIESHIGWFEGPASLLATQGYDVYCLDRRGSGMNRENRQLASGHMRSFEQLLEDIHNFVTTLEGQYHRVTLAGSSWGGKLALAYGLAYPHDSRIAALIMVTPGLRAKVDLNPFTKIGVTASLLLRPKTHFDVPIRTELFTNNEKNLDLIRRDPLRLHSVSARFYWESLRLDWFIDRHMHKNRLPILLILAGQDRVIDNEGVIKVLGRGLPNLLDIHCYEDQTHAVQLDAPERLAGDMGQWLQRTGSALDTTAPNERKAAQSAS